jgi:glyoxylase-like metal-dependent hydrolase (beta-lactamase superfamily II)
MPDFPRIHDCVGKFMVLPRDHVHSYVVELRNSVVVVDTTLAISSATQVRTVAESFGKPIAAVLLTHGHPDHYTGLVQFPDVPRFASRGCLEFAQREDIVKSPTAKSYLGTDYPDKRVFPDQIVKDGETCVFDGVSFKLTDLGPAESDSDGMWTLEFGGATHAFLGDAVANRCHCFFRDGHLFEWLMVLDRLEREFDKSSQLYVGHGTTPSALEAIEWQRGYLKAFRDAVAIVQDRSLPVGRATQMKIIEAMQKYLPGEATLFLLDYELDVSIPALWNRLAAMK